MNAIATLCLSSAALASTLHAAEQTPKWLEDGPYIEGHEISVELPLEMLANMLLVEVQLGGTSRRFLLDTGSVSMMDTHLAQELALEVVDRRQSQDSHGAIIETDVVQAELTLGTIPDHPQGPSVCRRLSEDREMLVRRRARLGSAASVRVADRPARLRAALQLQRQRARSCQRSQATPLYNFGYPHAPILDIGLANDATSKALFDTGSPEYLAISPPDLDGARRNKGVGPTVAGHGSLGGSMGGLAPEKDQLRVRLNALAIGAMRLGAVDAVLRETPPSLIGAPILEHFVVTLDTRAKSAWFDAYRDGPLMRPSYGLALAFEDGVSVSLVWDDSPAAAAGLRVGHELTSINQRPARATCDGIRSAIRAMSTGNSIQLGWDENTVTLIRAKLAAQ
ncbi:MAG: hypothetical protein U1A22_04960 [Xanthomonadaceae bacterium]|nr:hypothetical protein [Xanthomonadaceae bacterium]